MEYELFFVALYKHEAPQALQAGPFLDEYDAREAIPALKHKYPRSNFTVMKTTLQLEEVQ